MTWMPGALRRWTARCRGRQQRGPRPAAVRCASLAMVVCKPRARVDDDVASDGGSSGCGASKPGPVPDAAPRGGVFESAAAARVADWLADVRDGGSGGGGAADGSGGGGGGVSSVAAPAASSDEPLESRVLDRDQLVALLVSRFGYLMSVFTGPKARDRARRAWPHSRAGGGGQESARKMASRADAGEAALAALAGGSFMCGVHARTDRTRIVVGMVGFPNVGKSSVINTLIGAHGPPRAPRSIGHSACCCCHRRDGDQPHAAARCGCTDTRKDEAFPGACVRACVCVCVCVCMCVCVCVCLRRRLCVGDGASRSACRATDDRAHGRDHAVRLPWPRLPLVHGHGGRDGGERHSSRGPGARAA